MKRIVIWSFLLLLVSCKPSEPIEPDANANKLEFSIRNMLNSKVLIFDEGVYTNQVGNDFKVSSFKYLMSNFVLIDENGNEFSIPNSYAFLDQSKNRNSFTFSDIPNGNYKKIKFQIGLDSAANHGDPSQYAIDNPLNPLVNNMHWSWSGGYVFILFEGDYLKPNSAPMGFSYHIAIEENIIRYEMPISFSINKDKRIISLDIVMDEIFKNPNLFDFEKENLATHSSTDGGLANRLRDNMKDMFVLNKVE